MLASVLIGVLYIYPIGCQEHRKLEPKVIQGEHSRFTDFSYSALLGASCEKTFWNCGSSILTQYILLTAAHCIHDCSDASDKVLIKCGNSDRNKGKDHLIMSYVFHPKYKEIAQLGGDIGLVRVLKPIKLSMTVGRVAVMPSPPLNELATVAGWGKIHDHVSGSSKWLRHVNQTITLRRGCEEMIGKLPVGLICGGTLTSESYPTHGDSGSALVVRGIIQVGIVSFMRRSISKSVVAYTDISYYYDWIVENTNKLICGH